MLRTPAPLIGALGVTVACRAVDILKTRIGAAFAVIAVWATGVTTAFFCFVFLIGAPFPWAESRRAMPGLILAPTIVSGPALRLVAPHVEDYANHAVQAALLALWAAPAPVYWTTLCWLSYKSVADRSQIHILALSVLMLVGAVFLPRAALWIASF